MAIAKGTKRVAENRKARHEYFIEDTYECGIALAGTEVKSIRAGKVNLKDSYAQVKNGECYLIGMHVSPYEQGNIFNRDPFRERKLLLHKSEIRKLNALAQVEGYSLIPLQLYFKDGRVKLELAVAKGKKLYDKRSDIASRDAKREVERRAMQPLRQAQPAERGLRYENPRSALCEEKLLALVLPDQENLDKAAAKISPDAFSSAFLAKIYQKALERRSQGLEPSAAACMAGLEEGEIRHLSGVLADAVRSRDPDREMQDYIDTITFEHEKKMAQDGDEWLRQAASRRRGVREDKE